MNELADSRKLLWDLKDYITDFNNIKVAISEVNTDKEYIGYTVQISQNMDNLLLKLAVFNSQLDKQLAI